MLTHDGMTAACCQQSIVGLKSDLRGSMCVACRIHQYNVEAVMLCILPYHGTGQFVRVLQILHIQNTVWAFLQPAQKSGAPVPRSSLVQRCQRDKVRFAPMYCGLAPLQLQ